MSRAIQIKHSSEILGVDFKITDDDIVQAIDEIISNLHMSDRPKIHYNGIVRRGYEFSLKIETGENSSINYVYIGYYKDLNVLVYTTHFTRRFMMEGFKVSKYKFHTLLLDMFSKRFKHKIGSIKPLQRGKKFPVC